MFDREEIISNYPALECCRDSMEQARRLLVEMARSGHKLLLCGNGGSCADCGHIAGELMKGFLKRRPLPQDAREAFCRQFGEDGALCAANLQEGIPTIALTEQSALMTAVLNDMDPRLLYAQQAWNYAAEGDVLIGISTSGNAANVRLAAQAALLKGASFIAMTGEAESPLSAIATVTIHAPDHRTARVQEYHIAIYHWLCAEVEEAMYRA